MTAIHFDFTLMRYKDIIECEDSYEAEKLAAFLAKQKNDSSLIQTIKARDNEIIITLADKSAHCITLRDRISISKLVRIMRNILEGKGELYGSKFDGASIYIEYLLK